MASSVDGLVSGMSTSTVIQQLMQVESAGQTKLKDKVTAHQKATTALQSVNSKAAALSTAAETLLRADTWKLAKATSSSDALTVSASSGATAAQLNLAVTGLAKNHVRTVSVAGTGAITTGSGVAITIGSTTTNIAVTTDTASGVASAINAAGIDVKAAVVNADGGETILQLTSTKTGAASQFTISGLQAGGGTVISQGTDAQLTVGTVGAGGYTVSSSTNTFTNALPNVTMTAVREQAGITVTVQSDADGIAAKVQALVDAANGVLSEVDQQAVLGGPGRTAGPLAGNSLLRQLSSDVLSSAAAGQTGYGSFKQFGVELTRTGRLAFDKAKFVAAYQANPAAVEAAVTGTGGLAKTLDGVADKAKTNLTDAIQSRDTAVRGLNDQIARWDVRLKLRQDALQRQFANLEIALGKMKDQSSWLAGQIASLG